MRFNPADRTFQVYSGLTTSLINDVDRIIAYCGDYCASFADQAAFDAAVSKAVFQRCVVPRPEEEALADHLNNLFGASTSDYMCWNDPPVLSLAEFRRMVAGVLVFETASIVAVSSVDSSELVRRYELNVREV